MNYDSFRFFLGVFFCTKQKSFFGESLSLGGNNRKLEYNGGGVMPILSKVRTDWRVERGGGKGDNITHPPLLNLLMGGGVVVIDIFLKKSCMSCEKKKSCHAKNTFFSLRG